VGETEINILISEQALNRLKKDRFVSQNKKWYDRQVRLIATAPAARPTEGIGGFKISPRGHEKRRIAWHFIFAKNTIVIFIDDLLYHTAESRYIDNWNYKAQNGTITLKNYGPYIQFVGL